MDELFLRSSGCAAIRQPVTDLIFQPLNALRVKAVAGGRSFSFAVDQPSFAQHFEMLADRGLRQGHFPDDIVGDAGLVGSQEFHNLEADRVAQSLEHPGEAFLAGCQGCFGHIIVIIRYKDGLSRGKQKAQVGVFC